MSIDPKRAMQNPSALSVRGAETHGASLTKAAMLWLLLLHACFVVAACGTLSEYHYHGIVVHNKSSSAISNVEVTYGAARLNFGALAASGSRGISQDMAIADTLTIRWAASGGTARQASAPIKVKGLLSARQVSTLEVHITGTDIEVYQGVLVKPAGRELTRIFP